MNQDYINQFELTALTNHLQGRSGDRLVFGFGDQLLEKVHRQRYEFAKTLVGGKTVLDIACGAGWGSYIMATEGQALHVTGADIDAEIIKYDSAKYISDNLSFKQMDGTNFDASGQYDFIVSFETIEHFPQYESFLNNVCESLKSGGLILISTPVSNQEINLKPETDVHTQEWGFEAFQKLISKYFQIEKVFIQQVEGKSFFHKISWAIKCKISMFLNLRGFRSDFSLYLNVSLGEYKANKGSEVPRKGYQLVLARKQ